jgi:putative endonuclease
MVSRRDVGAFGERVAAARLEAVGMRILERNVRTPHGEIDIIARDGEDVAFVEVRARRAVRGLAAETLRPVKLRRMWQCALDYCEMRGLDPECVRIDAVAVDIDPNSGRVAVEHFRALEIPDMAED